LEFGSQEEASSPLATGEALPLHPTTAFDLLIDQHSISIDFIRAQSGGNMFRVPNWVRTLNVCYAVLSFVPTLGAAQSLGNAGTLVGDVIDPNGAAIANAAVRIENPVSGYRNSRSADKTGHYEFTNVPFNPYHVVISAPGFAPVTQDIDIRSTVPVHLRIALSLAKPETIVTVPSGADLVENDSTFHTDIDRDLFKKLPLESQSSSVSSLVTLASPGIAADSNGLFHGLGDHAENSFSVDGQPITDQQSKVFSNQIPMDSVQSLEVVSGAPTAEYGDKTSLIIKVTTRSGQGLTKPTGSIRASYGTFGSANAGFDLGYGGERWGNFVAVNGLKTGRFLDGPEFHVFHNKGNQQNIFDRIDYQFDPLSSAHLNLQYTRSWFQTPNAYDNLHVTNVVSGGMGADPHLADVGDTDQHSKIETFNIAPTYTRLLSSNSVLNFGAFVRKDAYHYYPSGNPLADLGPANLQRETIAQTRTLLNAGVHSDFSYVEGVHTLKAGAVYEQTILREHLHLGIVDSTLNAPCLNGTGTAIPGFMDPSQCAPASYAPNSAFNPSLLPYDLTRSGQLYSYTGHTDVKQLALYVQDQIKTGNWLFNVGIRGDLYNGLAIARQAEPRAGIAYTIKSTNTVLRISYARALETPFNENLVLSSLGCRDAVLNPLLSCTAPLSSILVPGHRNEFHAGFQQAFGRYLVVSGEYIWKYTHNAYDFSVLGNTPITFPIGWHSSKIPGFALRASVPSFHGFSAFVVMSSVSARFFKPQVGGAGATVAPSGPAFRIDHDERYNQTSHVQYQPWSRGPWLGFNWRYDSGLVAGRVPFAANATTPVDLTGLTANQQMQAGLYCGNQRPTLSSPLTQCAPASYGSTLLQIPRPGSENDDRNPPRIAPRHLFDVALGDDDLFHGDRFRWSAQITAINIANTHALYNFLSTFSGTHYVTPRALTAEIAVHF
jgi:hypothetical protein